MNITEALEILNERATGKDLVAEASALAQHLKNRSKAQRVVDSLVKDGTIKPRELEDTVDTLSTLNEVFQEELGDI